ncbi:hypothetical protein DL96DRAFT_1581763 [Flagelloscypha sp. PMI_526]|nr:hypothetical protein DL96DRAFT_1581763 [Flagelloscypha sp. PMI_526]
MSPQVWLITGTSSGLGRAGQIVVSTGRNLNALENLKARFPSTRLLTLKLDAAFSAAVEHFGRVDVVYSNSGYGIVGELESVEDDAARSLFEVNLWGAANIALEAVRVFRDVNKPAGGRLLLASSYSAITAPAGMGHYSASKFAIDGYHEALSKEMNPSWNIKINILELGTFTTNAFQNAQISQPHPAYLDSPISDMRKLLANPDETLQAFSAKPASVAAKVFYDIAGDANAPLRIPVGPGSIGILKGRAEEIVSSIEYAEKWKELLQ